MRTYVNQLETGQFIEDQTFAVDEIQKHSTVGGKPYYNITLADKTGSVRGKIWENSFSNCEGLETLKRGDVVNVWMRVETFKDNLQVNIVSMKIPDSYDVSVLLKTTDKDIDAMWSDLLKVIENVENSQLKELLTRIFSDTEISNKFRSVPAGEFVHHDYVGGLLEHTMEMIVLAKPYEKFYSGVDFDLVYAGILLHDIGKTIEINQIGTVYDKPVEGVLIGHLHLGLELIRRFKKEDMNKNLWMHLVHIMISHHGEFADIKPATIEAGIVSVVDFGSSRIRQYQKEIQKGEENDDDLSNYQKYLQTFVYIGKDRGY